MGTITTKDGTEIYYKDWGKGQPIVFSHGWPLSADDWDTQMLCRASTYFNARRFGFPRKLLMVGDQSLWQNFTCLHDPRCARGNGKAALRDDR
jgi:pimeloyl-ACP methyl ester carboxylesterase